MNHRQIETAQHKSARSNYPKMESLLRARRFFLTDESDAAFWRELVLEGVVPQQGLGQTVGIKLEVDTMPPPGFTECEDRLR